MRWRRKRHGNITQHVINSCCIEVYKAVLRNVVVYHVATQTLSIPTANVLVAIQLKGWVHTLTGLDRLQDNMLCNPVEREKRHKVHVRAHTHTSMFNSTNK